MRHGPQRQWETGRCLPLMRLEPWCRFHVVLSVCIPAAGSVGG